MKNTSAKVISALMIATAILGFAAVLPIHADVWGNTNPTIFVDPQNNIFPPPPMTIGDTFSVNVTIANCSGIGGIQFRLTWDPTLLFAVSITERFFYDPAITPQAEIDAGDQINYLKHTINNTEGSVLYGCTYYDMDRAKNYVPPYAPINITMANWAEGKHAIATIVFRVLQIATKVPGFVTCGLNFDMNPSTGTIIGDVNGAKITVANINGLYRLNWSEPTTHPYYSVVPSTYTAYSLGEVFNISVLINNLDPAWEAVGFEFKLSYDPTILNIQKVYEGPWLKPFGAPPNQGTAFYKFFGANYVQLADLVLPDEFGSWHPPFPNTAPLPGSGVVAIIQFNATAQGVFPEPDLSCPLHLYDTIVADWHAVEIDQGTSLDGFYSIKSLFPVTGRVIDIFTAWPAPYGGQGPNQPSDMFWPQKEVCIYANVTYNGWPEQMKDVAFSIQAPDGTVWGIVYGRTDATGLAKVSFRLPWPCDNPEQWFGVWTVTGTVDIACIIVNDTVSFHYDYLVRIFKVTVDQESYNHEPNPPYIIYVNVTYGTYLWQDSIHYVDQDTGTVFDLDTFTVTTTGLDNTNVPFDYAYLQTPIAALSDYQRWHYCEYRNITVILPLIVPKFARAGPGEVDTAILDNWPFDGGTVQSGYYDPVSGTWLPYCPTPIIINAA